MRIPRIYQPGELASGNKTDLDERAAHHIAHVLRLKPGAPVIVFDGLGHEFSGEMGEISKRQVTVVIGARIEVVRESPLRTVLAQGVSRGERMDYTIQKAVELGVQRITPLLTEHTMVSLAGERRERRVQHWSGVAIGACEQCGRNVLPQIDDIQKFDAWLSSANTELKLVLHHEGQKNLAALPVHCVSVTLLIGPEGGLSDDEVRRASAAGFVSLRLGPRILRTETAGMAALAALQARWGDLC